MVGEWLGGFSMLLAPPHILLLLFGEFLRFKLGCNCPRSNYATEVTEGRAGKVEMNNFFLGGTLQWEEALQPQ